MSPSQQGGGGDCAAHDARLKGLEGATNEQWAAINELRKASADLVTAVQTHIAESRAAERVAAAELDRWTKVVSDAMAAAVAGAVKAAIPLPVPMYKRVLEKTLSYIAAGIVGWILLIMLEHAGHGIRVFGGGG